jgi:hypothetical protein
MHSRIPDRRIKSFRERPGTTVKVLESLATIVFDQSESRRVRLRCFQRECLIDENA